MPVITTEKDEIFADFPFYKVFVDGEYIGYGWTEDDAITFAERYIERGKIMTYYFISYRWFEFVNGKYMDNYWTEQDIIAFNEKCIERGGLK